MTATNKIKKTRYQEKSSKDCTTFYILFPDGQMHLDPTV